MRIIFFALLVVFTIDASSQIEVVALDSTEGARFGNSIYIHGDYAIIGASSDTMNGDLQRGSVYIFKHVDGTWTQVCKLITPAGDYIDYFGWNVSMTNDYAIVSSFNAAPISDQFTGKAYIFKRITDDKWVLSATLHPADGISSSKYGHSVSISGDIAVVGAPYDTFGIKRGAGSVYVYYREGDQWNQKLKLVADEREEYDLYGGKVCLSDEKLIVGVQGDDIDNKVNQGSVYYYHLKGIGGITRKIKIVAGDGQANDRFGTSLNIKGDKIIIGSPDDEINGIEHRGSAYIYSVRNDDLTFLKKLKAKHGIAQDKFGSSVGIFNNRAVVSIPLRLDGLGGKIICYKKILGIWIRVITFRDTNPASNELIQEISISGRTVGGGFPYFDALKGKAIFWQL